MAVLVFGPMAYCENHRVFHRHSSYERGLVNFGYSKSDARWFAGYRYDAVEAERDKGKSTLQWAGPCEKYRDPSDAGCRTCYDTYQSFRTQAATLEAECFARGVLAHADDGHRLFFVTLKIPMVAVRDKSSYEGGRLAAYQKLSKKKRKAHAAAFKRKREIMLSERGVMVGPEYETPKRQQSRKDAHKRWMDDNHAGYYQLDCIKSDVMRSVVKTDGKFIERESAQGGGFRYVQRGDALVTVIPGAGQVTRPAFRYEGGFEGQAERVKPPALRWLFKQVEMRVRAIGRKVGFGIKYQAFIEQGSEGGFHYHILLHVFPTGDRPIPKDEDVKNMLMEEWFEVSGNVRFDEVEEVVQEDGSKKQVIRTWFTRVTDPEKAAAYASKYAAKGWFSRRQTSKFLNLRTAARDARLIKAGFLTEKITDVANHFHCNEEDGSLGYESPLEQKDIDAAGCMEWVGVKMSPQAPLPTKGARGRISVRNLEVVAAFWSSRPCTHPAAAKSGLCVDGDGNVQDFIPHAWWFPKDRLLEFCNGQRDTEQVQELHRQITNAKYRAITKAHDIALSAARPVSAGPVHKSAILGEVANLPVVRSSSVRAGMRGLPLQTESQLSASEQAQFATLSSVFTDGGYALQRQFNRMQKSVQELSFTIYNLFTRLGIATSALAEQEHSRDARPELPIDKPSWYRLSGRMRDRMRDRETERQMSIDVTF